MNVLLPPGWTTPRRAVTRPEATAAVSRLAALVCAGLATGDALASSARGGNRVLARLDSAVRRGAALSAAMSAPGLPFREAELAVVRAGEKGGNAARALALLAERMEREAGSRRRVASALAYPLLLAVGGAAALAFLALVVLPPFASMYAGQSAELPAATRALLRLGDLLRAHGLAAGVLVAALAAGFAGARARVRGFARLCDAVAIDAVPFRRLAAPRAAADAAALMALLLAAGCEADEALGLAARAAANRVVGERLAAALRALRHGVPLSRAWKSAGLDRSGDATPLLEIAEATGGYAQAFGRIAALEGDAAERALAAACRVAEPAAVVAMAAAVGGGVLAVYQPMLGSASLLLGGKP